VIRDRRRDRPVVLDPVTVIVRPTTRPPAPRTVHCRWSDYPDQVIVVDDGDKRCRGRRTAGAASSDWCGSRTWANGRAGDQDRRSVELLVLPTATPCSSPHHLPSGAAVRRSGVGAVSQQRQGRQQTRTVGRWQHIEYVMTFNLDRRLYGVSATPATVPGAVRPTAGRRWIITVGCRRTRWPGHHSDHVVTRAGWRIRYETRLTEARPRSAGYGGSVAAGAGTLQAVWKHAARCLARFVRAAQPARVIYLVLFRSAAAAGSVVDPAAAQPIFLDPLVVGIACRLRGINRRRRVRVLLVEAGKCCGRCRCNMLCRQLCGLVVIQSSSLRWPRRAPASSSFSAAPPRWLAADGPATPELTDFVDLPRSLNKEANGLLSC
jgi:hypothetical protein